MGKGDRKTRRGKLFQGSFGVRRRKKKDVHAISPVQQLKAKEVKAAIPEPKVPKEVPEVKAHKPVHEAKAAKEAAEVKVHKPAEAKPKAAAAEAKTPKAAPARKETKTKKEEGAAPKHE